MAGSMTSRSVGVVNLRISHHSTCREVEEVEEEEGEGAEDSL